jgi:sugar phosphate isomerase/epimerase
MWRRRPPGRETYETLAASGYDGFVSIEPHLGIHPDFGTKYATHIESGKRLEKLLKT